MCFLPLHRRARTVHVVATPVATTYRARRPAGYHNIVRAVLAAAGR